MSGPSTIRARIVSVRVQEIHYRRLTLAALISLVALIASGGWVRLTESGLGCPTWPKCYADRVTAHDTYHSLIEFGNRCVITAVGILVVLALLGALLRRDRRRDLCWLSGGLVLGYIAEAVLGGFTVLFKLAPALVAGHLVLGMVVLVDGVILHWRAGEGRARATPRTPPVGPYVRQLGQALLVAITAVVVLGTVATGSGPRAGSPDTKRFHFSFASTVELHAVVGMFLFGLVVGSFFLLRATGAPRRVQRLHLAVAAMMAAQGILGYIQYFTHLPIDLVEAHIVCAALLVIAVVRFNLELGPPRPGLALGAVGREPSHVQLGARSPQPVTMTGTRSGVQPSQ